MMIPIAPMSIIIAPRPIATSCVAKCLPLTCGICFDSYPTHKINSSACGHPYCCTCWAAYISTSINDGPGCLTLRCPDPSCGTAVSRDMINTLVSREDKERYYRYLLQSYVEDSRKCREEAHLPVDCETVAKWILKNTAESENMNWILANSKPCPKCKRPIEKNQGCMHMNCTPPCKFEFCWLCLGVWSDHGERTGGFCACNRYEAAKQEGV
ncbi:hypothetical protein AgCh_000043 [Apium graveolens]